MHPKATSDIAVGNTSDGDDEVNECFWLDKTNADLGLMIKPLVFRVFLNKKKNNGNDL